MNKEGVPSFQGAAFGEVHAIGMFKGDSNILMHQSMNGIDSD